MKFLTIDVLELDKRFNYWTHRVYNKVDNFIYPIITTNTNWYFTIATVIFTLIGFILVLYWTTK